MVTLVLVSLSRFVVCVSPDSNGITVLKVSQYRYNTGMSESWKRHNIYIGSHFEIYEENMCCNFNNQDKVVMQLYELSLTALVQESPRYNP